MLEVSSFMGSLQQVGIIHPALTFRTVPVVVPSERVLATYEVLSRPLYDCIVANAKESSSLAQTRDFLLPKLMSGEILLREFENELEAVL